MTEDNPFAARSLSWLSRGGLAGCGMILAGLLVLAALLRPDPRGLGTHQQLGLPPCSIQTWFHVRCPSCGMTTAWSHFVRGELRSACRANAGGLLLAALAVLACPWCLASARRGSWMWIRPTDWGVLVVTLGSLVVILVDWLVRVAMLP